MIVEIECMWRDWIRENMADVIHYFAIKVIQSSKLEDTILDLHNTWRNNIEKIKFI